MIPPHDTYIETICEHRIDRDARALMRSSATIPSNSSTAVPTGIWPSSSFKLVYRPAVSEAHPHVSAPVSVTKEADHVALLELLEGVPFRGTPRRCTKRLRGWRSVEWQVMNQEMWFNFAPERLHWARYGTQLHRPPAHQAQGPELGPALRGAAAR